MTDTITALATPPGTGGISVIRLSGPESMEIADKVFKANKSLKDVPTHTIHYGSIVDDDLLIDNVTAAVFLNPKSYTGEDIIEISCHGGPIVVSQIINLLVKSGARLADAGEFTKRAFLNGKLDLTQVEAVADMIHSVSIPGCQTSARQLSGNFTSRLSEFHAQLLDICSLVELELDFADEDVEFIDRKAIGEKIQNAIEFCTELSSSHRSAEILRSGYCVGIAGYPNAGKSTLFNALLKRERAIVSETPGTTRDYLDETIYVNDIAVRITDTAGIRETKDSIEIDGLRMAESVLDQSNMILVLNDVTISPHYSNSLLFSIETKYPGAKCYLVQNKIDKLHKEDRIDYPLSISAKQKMFINDLSDFIERDARESTERCKDVLINQRQATLLDRAATELENAMQLVMDERENELISLEIATAAKTLGEITGETWSEEVLNNIFSRFCIGK